MTKKTIKNEGDVLETIEGIRYAIFEAFANFQIVGENSKINKIFFDEKSSKTFRVSKFSSLKKSRLFMNSVQKSPVFFDGSSDFESGLVNDLTAY